MKVSSIADMTLYVKETKSVIFNLPNAVTQQLVSHAVVTPPTIKLFSLLPHNAILLLL